MDDHDSRLASRDGLLASLVQQPGWNEFVKVLDEQIDREVLRYARDLMASPPGEFSDAELQYRRGIVKGLKDAVRIAHRAKLRFDSDEEETNGV